jgi:hypothetical protein
MCFSFEVTRSLSGGGSSAPDGCEFVVITIIIVFVIREDPAPRLAALDTIRLTRAIVL